MSGESGTGTAGDSEPTGGVERVSAFSDGVFAIAITLLVLPLAEAHLRADHLTDDLLALVPEFLAFVLSFWVVSRFWQVHHEAFRHIVRADRTLLGVNLVFLFWVALLPFPTAVLGRYGDTTAGVVLYAGGLIATGLSSTLLWWYAAYGQPRLRRGQRPLIRPGTDAEFMRSRLNGGIAVTAAFVPSLPLAFVSPGIAEASWVLIVPFSVAARRASRRRRGGPSTPP